MTSESPRPDFIIDDRNARFGLEVTQVFKGDALSGGGTTILLPEARRQELIDKTRRSFERKCEAKLSVRILGNLDQDTLDEIEQELVSAQFGDLEYGSSLEFRTRNRTKVFVAKVFVSNWQFIGDIVGWGGANAYDKIQGAIAAKKEKLSSYIAIAGPDVRLLVVADRHFNSGKLDLTANSVFDFFGFSKVYFLSHPAYALELQSRPHQAME